MLKNTIKLAFRTMRRQKIYSFINIIGLAVGLTCCILLLLWIQDESGYDRFHENSNRIYRVTIKDKIGGSDQNFAVTSIAMAPVIKNEIPEILYAANASHRRRTTVWTARHPALLKFQAPFGIWTIISLHRFPR